MIMKLYSSIVMQKKDQTRTFGKRGGGSSSTTNFQSNPRQNVHAGMDEEDLKNIMQPALGYGG